MQRSTSMVLLLVSLSSSAMAATMSCPTIDSIKFAAGIYTAAAGKGEWIGSRPGNVSGGAAIQGFKEAIFIADTTKGSEQGRLQKCTYNLEKGKVLDMSYTRDDKKEQIFSVSEKKNWKKEEGPFGLDFRVCSGVAPDECKLDIIN